MPFTNRLSNGLSRCLLPKPGRPSFADHPSANLAFPVQHLHPVSANFRRLPLPLFCLVCFTLHTNIHLATGNGPEGPLLRGMKEMSTRGRSGPRHAAQRQSHCAAASESRGWERAGQSAPHAVGKLCYPHAELCTIMGVRFAGRPHYEFNATQDKEDGYSGSCNQ